jgi:hypothetical protein
VGVAVVITHQPDWDDQPDVVNPNEPVMAARIVVDDLMYYRLKRGEEPAWHRHLADDPTVNAGVWLLPDKCARLVVIRGRREDVSPHVTALMLWIHEARSLRGA